MTTPTDDRTALITGANNGIGLELTRKLLNDGWQVIALIRSTFPEDDTSIKEAVRNKQLRFYKAELTDFDSLQLALKQITAEVDKIDLMFNNAGGSLPELSYSKQGREKQFELHTVVPYVILMALKEKLLRGSMKTVINTSTSAFKYLKEFAPDKLERPEVFVKLYGSYATSKLALSLWTGELAPMLAAEGIKLLSVDPGANNTLRKGKKSGIPIYLKPLMKFFFAPPTKGATLLYEAALQADKYSSGVFLVNGNVRELKFLEQGPKILEKVNAIYEREFAAVKVETPISS